MDAKNYNEENVMVGASVFKVCALEIVGYSNDPDDYTFLRAACTAGAAHAPREWHGVQHYSCS
jgi:hypothetical protein